jgi:prepilin-type processing-associated H-X9-DG protein
MLMFFSHKAAGRGRGGGFSLVELMVVIGLMVVLAGVVAITAGRGAALARRTLCSSNLNHLGQGYAIFQAQTGALDDMYRGLLGSSWAGQLLPHVSYHGETLICPEAEASNEPSTPKFCKRNWGHIQWDFFNFDPVWETQPYSTFWDSGRVPTMWKMNDEDYAVWRAKSKVGWGVMSGNKDWLPQYTPGTDPKSYWIVFEDEGQEWTSADGGGHDYRDYAVHVVEKGPGSYEMMFYEYGSSVANHGVVSADGEEVWIAEASGDGGVGVGPFYFSDPATNYGLHAGWPKFIGRLALILDYNDRLCHPGAELDAPEAFEKNIDPRHLGRCNVLFTDGGVATMAPEEFTPRNEQLHKTFWELPKKR